MAAVERETRQSILDAAAGLFGERGYRATTTRAIAERAGVNEVTIFRQFGNKKGLLRALVDDWAGTMAGLAVADLPTPVDTLGALESLAAMEVRQARQFGAPALRLAFDATSEPDVMEVMGAGPAGNLDGLADYLAARQVAGDLRPDLDPRVMAEAFFALTSTFIMSRLLLGERVAGFGPETDEVARQMLEIYLTGVGLKRAGRARGRGRGRTPRGADEPVN